jgi:hypothetical protein
MRVPASEAFPRAFAPERLRHKFIPPDIDYGSAAHARLTVVPPPVNDAMCDPRNGLHAGEAADRIMVMDQGCSIEESAPETCFRAPPTEQAKNFLTQIIH